MSESARRSLIEILRARRDTGFEGKPLNAVLSVESYSVISCVKDIYGNYFTQPHDYLAVEEQGGEFVGILADEDGRNSIDSEKSHLPHPIGLFVKEGYRGEGIATKLLHEFMDTVDAETCVVDCNPEVVPFYEQLDCNVIYARSLKCEVDVAQYHNRMRTPQSDREYEPSPEWDVPFFAYDDHDGKNRYHRWCSHYGTPAVRIEEERLGGVCQIAVDVPTLTDGEQHDYPVLTEDASDKINTVLESYQDCAWIREKNFSGIDFFTLPWMLPGDARQLADEIYPIITANANLELNRDRLDVSIDDIDSLQEITSSSHCVECGEKIQEPNEDAPVCNYCWEDSSREPEYEACR